MPKTFVAPEGGKRHPLSMRTTEALRRRLEGGAAASGRSLAQEMEARLEWTFNENSFYGREIVSTMAHLIGSAVKLAEDRYGPWHSSKEAATACRQAAISVLNVFIKPPGYGTDELSEEELANEPLLQGENAALQVMMNAVERDAAAKTASKRPREAGELSRRRKTS